MPWESSYVYTQALRVGDTIYISGQLSHDDDGNLIGTGDIEAQVRQTYMNIQKVLAMHGATVDNIVEEVVYVTNIPKTMEPLSKTRKEVFKGKIPPASTLVQVVRLSFDDQLIEIKCIAKV